MIRGNTANQGWSAWRGRIQVRRFLYKGPFSEPSIARTSLDQCSSAINSSCSHSRVIMSERKIRPLCPRESVEHTIALSKRRGASSENIGWKLFGVLSLCMTRLDGLLAYNNTNDFAEEYQAKQVSCAAVRQVCDLWCSTPKHDFRSRPQPTRAVYGSSFSRTCRIALFA